MIGEALERRKDAAEEGGKKHGPPSQPIGRHDGLNIEAVEAVVARCCQVPPGAARCLPNRSLQVQDGPLEGSSAD